MFAKISALFIAISLERRLVNGEISFHHSLCVVHKKPSRFNSTQADKKAHSRAPMSSSRHSISPWALVLFSPASFLIDHNQSSKFSCNNDKCAPPAARGVVSGRSLKSERGRERDRHKYKSALDGQNGTEETQVAAAGWPAAREALTWFRVARDE